MSTTLTASRPRSKYLALAALVFYWAALFWGTHTPNPISGPIELSDKLMHGGAYFGLSFLLANILSRLSRNVTTPLWSIIWRAILVAMFYGVLDEFTQTLVQGRQADFWDWCADAVGAGLGGFGFYWIRRWGIV